MSDFVDTTQKYLKDYDVAVIDGDRGKNYPSQGDLYNQGDCLFLSAKNVTASGFKFDKCEFISAEKDLKLNKGKLTRGDIVITTRGTVGAIALYNSSVPYDHVRINSGMVILRNSDKDLEKEFLYLFLRSPLIEKQLKRVSFGSAQPQLTVSIIKKLLLPVQPLGVQKKIVEVVKQWDTAIEKTEALIAAKERQFKWLGEKLLDEKREYLIKLGDYFGKGILIEKGKPLTKKDVADNGGIPVIAGGKTSPYNHNQHTHSMPCITVSASGAYAGYVAYHDYPIWASDCNVIYSAEYSTEYLYFALKSKQSRIYDFQSGGGQPHVYARDLKNINIPLPSVSEQKRIALIFNTAHREIDLLKKLAKHYHTQKRGLMQKLLTGKWRVKNYG